MTTEKELLDELKDELKLLDELKCDELCFAGKKARLKEAAIEAGHEKQCLPCDE